jgi:hypothetical protein
VSIDDVLVLAKRLDDIGANKGIIVSTIGFQEGARKIAEASGISLVKKDFNNPDSWEIIVPLFAVVTLGGSTESTEAATSDAPTTSPLSQPTKPISEEFGQEELRKRDAGLRKLIKHSLLTTGPLESDWKEVLKRWQQEKKSQFWSRIAIRCLCAAIEARLFVFRRMAEQMAPLAGVQFEAEEMEILSGERLVIKDGVQTKRPKWLPFPDSLKESFRLFAKASGAIVKIDFGTVGFGSLCSTFDVRNRLMHPKKPFDVEVNARDIDTAEQGIDWFNKTYTDLIDQCQAHLDQAVKDKMKSGRGPILS